MKVLYVEDSVFDAELTTHALAARAPDIGLTVVGGLAEARSRLRQDDAAAFDLVLSDMYLPDGNGLELLDDIQADGVDLPLVMITGHGSEDGAARALERGAFDYVVKSDRYLETLPEVLRKVIRQAVLRREKRNTEAVLRQLNEVLAASATLLFRLGIDGDRTRRTWVSANCETMLGYTQEEVLDCKWWMAGLYAADREAAIASQRTVLRTGDCQLEYRFHRKDGQCIWLRERLHLVRDAAGLPVEVVGTWTDITDEKNLSVVATLRQAVRNRVYEYARLEDVLAEVDDHLGQFLPGWQTAILLREPGNPSLSVVSAPDMSEAQRQIIAAMAGQQCVYAVLHSGEPQLLPDTRAEAVCAVCELREHVDQLRSVCVLPLTDSSGQQLGVVIFYSALVQAQITPLTGQFGKFAEIAAEAIERFRTDQYARQAATVLDNTLDGVIVTDLTPRILSVNKAWCSITGYSADEAIGHNPSMLNSGLQSAEFYESMWSSLKNEGDWQGEVWNRRKNGENYPQLLRISTVRDAQGQPRQYVGVITDLTRLRQSEAERDRLTHYDLLTGLPNRLLAVSRLEHAIEQAERDSGSIALLYLDLDEFQTVNNSLGHETGDRILRLIANRLHERLRGRDTLARLAGDEFVLILEEIDSPDAAARLAEQLLDLLREPVQLEHGPEVYVAASIGISIYPHDGARADVLLQHAETALFQAKRLGRGQYCYYTSALTDAVRQRLAMETQMRHALERGELSLAYQPQVDIVSGRVNGVEALMRWQSESLGRISPSEFIPVAEQSGLILKMGAWALREACRQNKAWQEAGLPALCMSVNVSVRQFKSGDLVDVVRQALAESGLAAQWLELELTETVFLDRPQEAVGTCQQLRRLGVKLSLDDFGTGYSSLAYLSRFPFDKIKIDQSFVSDIVSNPVNAAIADATIALANSLRMRVLAEGVETESQLNFIRQRGCSSMQGFLFSRPLFAGDFERLLREARRLPEAQGSGAGAARTLLLLDDEANVLRALQRLLRPEGYKVLATTSAVEAFELLAKNPVQVIVSDQRMPEMSGVEFLEKVKALHPETIRIVLSGYAEIETITQAVNRGSIYKFFSKPWDDARLIEELRDAFRVAERRGSQVQ